MSDQKRAPLIGSAGVKSASVQLVINSERQRREIRDEGKVGLIMPRHNIRVHVPVDVLAELGVDVENVGFRMDLRPLGLIRISADNRFDKRRLQGRLHLIEGTGRPYLQKGLADSTYESWIADFKEHSKLDRTKGREGWWQYRLPIRVKGDFIFIGGTNVRDRK